MWFRVELDKTGAIVACKQVENRSSGSSLVVYVDADSNEKAVSYALEWRENYVRRTRENRARHVEKCVARGQCIDCPNEAEAGSRRCRRCIDMDNKKRRERHLGRDPQKPGPRPGSSQGTSVRLRLDVLREAQEKHQSSSHKQFARWLRNEIILCENKLGIKGPVDAANTL